jgi:PHD/YefM family antitoxin component YafN of YafNO toxin-antitoxin module
LFYESRAGGFVGGGDGGALAGGSATEVKLFTRAGERCYSLRMKPMLIEPEIVTRKGKPVSVILPIKEYQELLERAEDAADVAWLKRARRMPRQYRPLTEYLAERKSKSRV